MAPFLLNLIAVSCACMRSERRVKSSQYHGRNRRTDGWIGGLYRVCNWSLPTTFIHPFIHHDYAANSAQPCTPAKPVPIVKAGLPFLGLSLQLEADAFPYPTAPLAATGQRDYTCCLSNSIQWHPLLAERLLDRLFTSRQQLPLRYSLCNEQCTRTEKHTQKKY